VYAEVFLYVGLLLADQGLSVLHVNARVGTDCAVTVSPNPPFVPPFLKSINVPTGMFWYGDGELWTLLDSNAWHGPNPADCRGYCTKLTYWDQAFDGRKEPEPTLIVTGRRLDREVPLVVATKAHAVFIKGPMPAAMMTTIDIPESGCWEITAKYHDHKLSFVRTVEIPRR
jgi:hypothetical protein